MSIVSTPQSYAVAVRVGTVAVKHLQSGNAVAARRSMGHMAAAIRGVPGPAGQIGPIGPAGGTSVVRIAGETISALRAVYEEDGEVFFLDYRDQDHIDQLLGITLNAGASGAPITVQRILDITDAAWAWTPGRVYLGVAGALTQSPAADGCDVLIGSAVSATRIILNLQDPIHLED